MEAHSTAMQRQHRHEAGYTGLHGASSREFPDLKMYLHINPCREGHTIVLESVSSSEDVPTYIPVGRSIVHNSVRISEFL